MDPGDLIPTVDLYANTKRHTEPLYCTPSIHVMPTAGTTFSYAGLTPRGQTSRRRLPRPCSTERKSWLFVLIGAKQGEAAAWRPFLDRMTKFRVPIPDVPLYLSNGATSPL